MKSFVLTLCLVCLATSSTRAALVAYWNFNGLSIVIAGTPGTGTVPATIEASQGAGRLGLSGYGGLVDDFPGSILNVIGPDPAGASLTLIPGGTSGGSYPGNGTFITVQFSMTGRQNPIVSFDTRGTSIGYNSGAWAWSINGTDFTDIVGSNTATRSLNYTTASLDLSAIDLLDDASTVILRYTLSGAESPLSNNRIDNLQINAVPEPAVGLGAGLGLLGLLRRRRC